LKTEDDEKAELRKAFIKSRSALIPLDEDLAVEAAKTDLPKMGMDTVKAG